MAKSLVIVESPAKARTITRYLGRGFQVTASLGHVKDLPKKILAVDVAKGFEPTYEVIPGKTKVIADLRKAAEKAEDIYLATDPDREGEAICAHLWEILKNKKKRKFHRVMFNEITKEAIQEAFKHPKKINGHLVDAQQTRRILDRLVGYQVSPLLWEKVRRGISAGRVQTVTLRLIAEREREIQAFKSQEYWTMKASLEGHLPPSFEARATKFQGKALEIPNGASATEHRRALEKADFAIRSVTRKEKRKFPVAPFTTSPLQQEAWRKLHFSVKKTMMFAQKLYEGVELPTEGSVGLITYMRTDSTRVADSALKSVREFIQQNFGEAYLPKKPIQYKKKKGAQDAHEAVRPTDVTRTPDSLKGYLEPDAFKLYQLIWQRFVASQMNPAVFDQTVIEITAGEHDLRASGAVEKFKGFRAVYEEGKDEKPALEEAEEERDRRLPELTQGEKLKLLKLLPEQHFTEPPPRYNEATLVKMLEEKGIGRPSTYAAILSTIQNRAYVRKVKGRFYLVELGMIVTDLLVKSFSDIFDVAYTVRMEEELDEVEEGNTPWKRVLKEFYTKFKKDLKIAKKEMDDIKGEGIPTEEKCEKCGAPMVIRLGRHGRFLACTKYPDCKNTRPVASDLAGDDNNMPDVDEETCENCGKPMAVKRGRFGPFMACTGYPECKTTMKIVTSTKGDGKARVVADKPTGEKCPQCGNELVIRHGRLGEFTACSNYPKCRHIKLVTTGIMCPEKDCGGEIVERKSRRGRVFYGCSRYPDCTYTLSHKPLPSSCPQCGSPFLVERNSKRKGLTIECPKDDCGYERAAA